MAASIITDGRIGVQQSAISRKMALWLKMDEGTGVYFADSSPYHYDYSPLHAPPWRPSQVWATNKVATPTIANGFVYDPAITSTGTTGATEPVWPTTPGNTVVDNLVTWTCRAVPTDYWGTAGWATFTGSTASNLLYPRQRIHPRLRDFLMPTLANGLSYTAATLSLATSDNSINDSAGSPWGTLAPVAGDWMAMSGYLTDTANNGVARIGSVVAGKAIFDIGGPNAVATAGNTVTLRKVLAPSSLVIAFNVNSTMTTGGLVLFKFVHHLAVSGQNPGGFLLNLNSARVLSYQAVDAVSSGSSTLGGALTSGTNFHVTVVVNRELATPTAAVYINGTFNTQVNLTKRQMCNLLGSPLTGLTSAVAVPIGATPNGVTKMKDLQIYAGRSVPAGLVGSTPALIAKMQSGLPLSVTDWP